MAEGFFLVGWGIVAGRLGFCSCFAGLWGLLCCYVVAEKDWESPHVYIMIVSLTKPHVDV
jgi:hypothetical protein